MHRYSPLVSVGLAFAMPGEPYATYCNDFFYGSSVEVGLIFTQKLPKSKAVEAEVLADYSRQEQP